ncbi:alpha/beta hydrolase [Kineococcus glutinatus]|uniref:Alpha/beta fold hydrolase n=1 Tax=Kineococcus glutinatus TaxID=1070872 RepID=A0ABP9H9P1_9ACTN
MPTTTSTHSAAASSVRTFLLVHGSGSSSHSWAPLERELALRGQRTYAVDLPGHGFDACLPAGYDAPQDPHALATAPSTLAGVTLDDNVDVVLTAAERLAAHGPVVLVCASLGGVTATVAANRRPELFAGLVYVSAWVCVSRSNPLELMAEPEFATSSLPQLGGLAVGDPAVIGAARANYRTADPDLLADLQAATAHDISRDAFTAFRNIMEPDESLAVMAADARIDPDTWGQLPRTYVRLGADRSIPPALQDRMIREADEATPGNAFRVHTLDSSHIGFLFQPATVADLLLDA